MLAAFLNLSTDKRRPAAEEARPPALGSPDEARGEDGGGHEPADGQIGVAAAYMKGMTFHAKFILEVTCKQFV